MQQDWPKAVLFDLDGTLIESLADIAVALNRLLDEAGLPPFTLKEIQPMTGDGAAVLLERAFAARDAAKPADGLERFKTLYGAAVCVETRLYPEVREVLERLQRQGCRLGVATNKPAALSRAILQALNVDHLIDRLAGGDSYPKRKPHPDHLLLLLKDLDVAPAASVMVGDSENDVASARAAGLPVVACSFGYSKVPIADLAADRVIDGFDELAAALGSLAADQVARSSS